MLRLRSPECVPGHGGAAETHAAIAALKGGALRSLGPSEDNTRAKPANVDALETTGMPAREQAGPTQPGAR